MIPPKGHTIKKTTSYKVLHHRQSQPQRHGRQAPVIIYAYSPKVIHTRAEDLMALVQRLTGLGEIIRRNPNDVSEYSYVVTEEVKVGDDDTTEPYSQEKEERQKLAEIPRKLQGPVYPLFSCS